MPSARVPIWEPLLPAGVSHRSDVYEVAGGHVGTTEAVVREIKEQTDEWARVLRMVTEAKEKPIYPTFLAIKLAFNPTTKFGHHFGCQPMSVTADIATETKGDIWFTRSRN